MLKMLTEFILKKLKCLIKIVIVSILEFVIYGSLIYYCLNILSKIFNSCCSCCSTYVFYFMKIVLNHFLKATVEYSNNLCFDVLKIVYEQNSIITSYFDIIDLLIKKNNTTFEGCNSGLATVISHHCSSLVSLMPNSVQTSNQGHWNGMFSFGNCVSKISSVLSDYCNWTDPNSELAQKADVNSFFDYFSLNKIEHSHTNVPSFQHCQSKLTNAISEHCGWFLTNYEPKSIEMGYVFNTFERFCLEQEKNLGVELCVDGLHRVTMENCVWLKMYTSGVNNVTVHFYELEQFFKKNTFFILILSIIACCGYFIVNYLYKKVYHFFVYDNDFLKKYPKDKNDIIIINRYSNQYLADVINKLKNGNPPEFKVLGLDCEVCSNTTNNGRPCPAILQLARPDGYCVIFQLLCMEGISLLKEILNDKDILFVGVGVLNDVENLKMGWNLTCNRCLDIRHVAANLKYDHPLALKDLADKVLNVKLKKNLKLGPWETGYLTEKQTDYAAKDAILSVQIFMKLNNEKIFKSFSEYERLLWDEKSYWKHTKTLWNDFINLHYNGPQPSPPINIAKCLSSDAYESQYMFLKPESITYINSIEPVKLCVVCGKTGRDITTKAIVPLEYRVKLYTHLPHYLNLCKRCLIENQRHDFTFRNVLSDICAAPYPNYMNEQLLSVKMLSKSILLKKNTMNDPYINKEVYQLIKTVSEEIKISPEKLTFRNIEIISNMDCWIDSSHAQAVRAYFNMDHLRRLWCENLIRTMSPTFLPESWKWFYRTDEFLTL